MQCPDELEIEFPTYNLECQGSSPIQVGNLI